MRRPAIVALLSLALAACQLTFTLDDERLEQEISAELACKPLSTQP